MKSAKKFALVLTTALLVMVMAIGLVACGKSNSIKKAFEDEGYTVTTVDKDSNELTKALYSAASEDNQKLLDKAEIIFVTKNVIHSALILKFPSASTLKDYLGDNYDKAVDDGLINGECTLSSIDPEIIKIFKNA